MKKDFINVMLINDLEELTDKVRIIEISKGTVSGNSIEVTEREINSQNSYVYYDRVADRDKDYKLLLELIEAKIEKNES